MKGFDLHELLIHQIFFVRNRFKKSTGKFNLIKDLAYPYRSDISFPLAVLSAIVFLVMAI